MRRFGACGQSMDAAGSAPQRVAPQLIFVHSCVIYTIIKTYAQLSGTSPAIRGSERDCERRTLPDKPLKS